LTRGLELSRSISASADELPAIRKFAAGDFARHTSLLAWEAGYDCARDLRKYLGLNGEPLSKEFEESLGFGNAKQCDAENLNIDGLVVRDSDTQRAGFVLSGKLDTSRRFAYARSLYEYLACDEEAALVSKAITYRQRRNRAFAAELLAPAEALRERTTGNNVSQDTVDRLASEFGVSQYVIEHQIENHKIATLVKQ